MMRFAIRKGTGLATIAIVAGLLSGTAAAQEFKLGDVPGDWLMRGYGYVYSIDATNFTQYDVTDVSCVLDTRKPIAKADNDFDGIRRNDDVLSLREAGGVTRYTLDLQDVLRDDCAAATEAPRPDPVENFEALWHAFSENYAFFRLRGVDWDALYRQYQPKVTAATSRKQLLEDIFTPMLKALNDDHVGLTACTEDHPDCDQADCSEDCDSIDSGGPGEMLALWCRDHTCTDGGSGDDQDAMQNDMLKYVLNNVLNGKGHHDKYYNFIWGKTGPAGDVGYLYIPSMELTGQDASGDVVTLPMPQERALVDALMPQIIKDLQGVTDLIIDARFNEGGDDVVGLQIMTHLTSERLFAFSKSAIDGDGETCSQQIWYDPFGDPAGRYSGRVYYLQSGETVSAGEAFTLAMMSLPTATRIGTHTYGTLSDQLDQMLPNRWQFTISNEIYRTADGAVYEGRGIPPDVPVDVQNVSYAQRRQLDIDRALSIIGGDAAGRHRTL